MNKKDNKYIMPNINEKSVYEGLFKIFEQEFLEITHYVAIIDKNLSTYSNKIHELHLRVCSEVENVIKLVIHKYFVEEENIKSIWENKKSSYLKKGDNDYTDDYEILKNKLNSKGKNELDKHLFGFPDFAFYYELACEKFNLHLKFVYFNVSISGSFSLKHFQPFFGKQEIPVWWTNYNGIKHKKIENYDECILKDLIHSFGTLYILMNYLSEYEKGNVPRPDENYFQKYPKGDFMGCDFWGFESNIFTPSYSFGSPFFPRLIKKMIMSEKEYNEQKSIIELANTQPQEKRLKDNTDSSNKLFEYPYSIFFTYFDYKQYYDGNLLLDGTRNVYRRLTRFCKFIN